MAFPSPPGTVKAGRMYATLKDALIEVGPKLLAELGSSHGTLPDDTTIDRELLSRAINSRTPAAVVGATEEEQAQIDSVLEKLNAKLCEANGQVDGVVSTLNLLSLREIPPKLRWASLELFLYELHDHRRPDVVLERRNHAQEYLQRLLDRTERIAGAVYAEDMLTCNTCDSAGIIQARLIRS